MEHAVLVRIRQELVPGQQVPFAPGRDDLHVGHQGIRAEFETNLVVALAGCAVGYRVGSGLACDLDQALGDQRTGDRGAQKILSLVQRVRPEHRKHEIADEFFTQILDVNLADTEFPGFPARRLDFLALPYVGRESHDFTVIGVLQPFQDDRCVQPAGIGEHDFADRLFCALLLHVVPCFEFI
jgi:hypothetical protein